MTVKLTILTTVAALAFSGASFAAGSDDTSPPKASKTTTLCKKGQVYDKRSKSCLDAKSELFDDDTIYAAARELAYDGQYRNAQLVLAAADNQNDPRILNYYGFTNRKQGKMKTAMSYYTAALKADPDYILARSYMGQGFLADGNRMAAKAQLAEIKSRGGADSWAYASLSKALMGHSTDY